ncbi:MAG: heavy-metal-associated domain-containing protein [Cyanobacteria bacterium SZAS TMP-1]|nr:heavy-metal-associated domain-containing protein [Cyanobacteria bacterium SZAS TMP-1]
MAKSSAPATSNSAAPAAKPAAKPAAAVKGLHRLDFRLEHATCPSCILKVRKALRATPGIEKCEIALRKPYGGVVIFDPAKVNAEKMQVVAREADPNKRVELADLLDQPITTIPALLLPKYTTLKPGP